MRRALDAFGIWLKKSVIIGTGTHRDSVKRSLSADFYLGYNVILDGAIGSYASLPRDAIGPRLDALLQSTDAHSIILAPSTDEMQYLTKLVDALNVRMIPYKVVPPLDRLPLAGLSTQSFISFDAVLLTVRPGLASPIRQALKRLFDIASSLLLSIALYR